MSADATVSQAGAKPPRHLWDYWRIVWEGKWLLLVSLGFTVAVAVVGTKLMAPRYKAEVLLEINLSQDSILGTATERSSLRGYFDMDRSFRTEFLRIRSRFLLNKAVEKHDLTRAVPQLARVRDTTGVLRGVTRIEPVSQTKAATLSVTWTDPADAAILANAIAETYVDWDLEEKVRLLEERAKKLAESAEETSLTRVEQLQFELAVLAGTPNLESVQNLPSLRESESLADLRTERNRVDLELQGLATNYGAKHPQVQSARAQLNRIDRQVREEIDAVSDRLESELRSLGHEPLPAEQAKQLRDSGRRTVDEDMNTLLRTSESQQRLFAALAEPKAKIIDPALPPLRAYSPNLMLNLALAIVVGLGFGGGLLFFRDYLDASVKTIDDVERDLGLNLLAVVPRARSGITPVLQESFRTLRTGLLFASRARQERILLVSSAAPQEGKTTCVSHLARSLAGSGESVLVVDCDLRRPSVARELKVPSERGLSSFLADGTASDWRPFVTAVDEKLSVLPAGPTPPNPLDLLQQVRFAELLQELKAQFDWVILDSPPVSSVSDGVVLASVAELVLLIIRHDQTDRDVVRRALVRLSGVGATVAGAVLNDVDMNKAYNRDYYYGRYYYGQYYGETKAEAKAEAKRSARREGAARAGGSSGR